MQGLTKKQEAAIAALLSTSVMKDAAAQVGISDVTLWRWLQLPEFESAYRAARRQVVEQAISKLQGATKYAVATLGKNLSCGNPAVEVRAASIILEQAVKGVELIELQERIERLEETLTSQEKAKGKRWA